MAGYEANIQLKVDYTAFTKLEENIKKLETKLASLATVDFFPGLKDKIDDLNKADKLLQKQGQQLEKVRRGSAGAAEKDGRVLEEQLQLLTRQSKAIEDKNQKLFASLDIQRKIKEINDEIAKGEKANQQFIRLALRNLKEQVAEEEKLEAAASGVNRQLNKQIQTTAVMKTALNGLYDGAIAGAKQFAVAGANAAKKAAGSFAKNLPGKVDSAFGGVGSNAVKTLEASAIRAGTVGLGIYTAKALAATEATRGLTELLPGVGGAISSLNSVINPISNAIAGLSDNWAMLAVAAAALLPVLPNIGQAAIKSVKGIGQLGKAISDLTGFSERVQPALNGVTNAVKKTNSTIQNNGLFGALSEGLFDLGPNSLDLGKQLGLQAANGAAASFAKNMQLALNEQFLKAAGTQILKAKEKTAAWTDSLQEGRKALMEMNDLGFRNMIRDLDRMSNKLDEIQRKREQAERARAEYFGTSNSSRQQAIADARRLTGNRTAANPALRPAGYTDQDVRITNQIVDGVKNLVDVQNGQKTVLKEIRTVSAEIVDSWRRALDPARRFTEELQDGTRAATQLERVVKNSRNEARKGRVDRGREQQFFSSAAQRRKGAPLFGQKSESLALGVGFPLLFGAGAGSIIGSGLGSFVGKQGFGGQILLGGVGQIIDQFAAAAIQAADALKDPIAAFDELNDTLKLFDKQGTASVKRLIEVGNFQEAANQIRDSIRGIVGEDGLRNLDGLSDANRELAKQWGELDLAIKAFIAGPLAALLNAISAPLRSINENNSFINDQRTIRGNLAGNQLKAYNDGIAALNKEVMEGNLTYQEAIKKASELNKEFLKFVNLPDVELTPEQREQRAEIGLANEERALALRQQGADILRDISNKERQFAEERYKLSQREAALRKDSSKKSLEYAKQAADLTRQAADIRRRVEDRIFQQRQAIAQQEIANDRRRAQLLIEQRDSALRDRRLSSNNPVDQFANEVLDIERQYQRAIAEATADQLAEEQRVALEIAKLNREESKFALEVAKASAKIREAATKYEADVLAYRDKLNQDAKKLNDDRKKLADRIQEAEFDMVRRIEAYKMAQLKERIRLEADPIERIKLLTDAARRAAGFEQNNTTSGGVLGQNINRDAAGLQEGAYYGDAGAGNVPTGPRQEIPVSQQVTAPSPDLSGLAAANRLLQETNNLTGQRNRLLNEGISLGRQETAQRLKNAQALRAQQYEQLALKAVADVEGTIRGLKEQLDYQQDYVQLLRTGITPEYAKQIVQFREQIDLAKRRLDAAILMAEATLQELRNQEATTEEIQKQVAAIDALRAKRTGLDAQQVQGRGLIDADQQMKRTRDYINQIQNQLADAEGHILNTAAILEQGLGGTMNALFAELTAGTMNFQQALAQSFKAIGDDFIKMGTRMIAQYLIMQALGIFMPGGGGAGGGLGGFGEVLGGLAGRRKNGGPVNAGDAYLVGESGREMFVPNTAGTVIPNDQLGGGSVNSVVNVTVNSDGSTTRDEEDMSQLGKLVEASVVGVITRERRPGGLLSR